MADIAKLDALTALINKKYGMGTIMRASAATRLEISRIPTGIPALDAALGGGIPRGRNTLLRGTESAGKSLLCQLTIAQAQSLCRYCGKPFRLFDHTLLEWSFFPCKCGKCEPHIAAWIDIEHSFDREWFATTGGSNDLLIVSQPDFAEQAIDVVDQLLRSSEVDIIVLDCIAALEPSEDVEKSVAENSRPGGTANLNTRAYRKWQSAMNTRPLDGPVPPPTLLTINQQRTKIGIAYGDPTTYPGGQALNKYFPSVVIDLRRKKPVLDTNKEAMGQTVAFLVSKNKTAPFGRNGEFDVFTRGIPQWGIRPGDTNRSTQLLRLALRWGLCTKKGSWFILDAKEEWIDPDVLKAYPNGRLGNGEENATEALEGDATLYQLLLDAVLQRESTFNLTPPPMAEGKPEADDGEVPT